MQHTPQLRVLPLLIAAAFYAHPAAAADAPAAPVPATTPAATDPASAADGAPDNAPIPQVEITAAHLRSARIDLSPNVGTTIYSIDRHMIDQLGQGDNTPFNEVLLRLPGVSQDSKGSGSIHVRDDHGNVQYRVNGVQLPESISGFGQSIDTRFVESTDFMTGALPAQFGLRTAGIVDIQTKEGKATPGGRIGVLVGSHDHVEPSAEFFGSQGAFNYYLSGSYETNNLGIENPLPTRSALHDRTRQAKSFGSLSYFLDDDTRLGLMFGTYNGRFQIPNNPNQEPAYTLAGATPPASAQLDERQREVNRFVTLSLQKTVGDLNYQVSAFHQYSELHYTPDPVGDLVYNGVASDTLRSNSGSGLQFDASYKLNEAHTVRAGLAYTRQTTHSDNTVGVFDMNDDGTQASDVARTIIDNSGKRLPAGRMAYRQTADAELRRPLRQGRRLRRRAAMEPARQPGLAGGQGHGPACRLFALLQPAAAGTGGAGQHRQVRRHVERAGDRRIGQRQVRAHALLRHRRQPPVERARNADRRRLLQEDPQHAG